MRQHDVHQVDSLKAHLLIAGPTLLDPNFARTVVLVAEHGTDGAMGVVLNRPTETRVADAVPPLEDLVPHGEPVYVGGPVQESGVVALAEFADPAEAAAVVLGDVGFLAAAQQEPLPASGTGRARVFAGHAGWGPGQLDAELERDYWIVEPATEEDVFAEDANGLWERVLERKGGQYALLARMPLDPRMN